MSEFCCEGITIQDEPFTAAAFMEFLKTHLKRYQKGERDGDEDIILVFDNARQHLAKATQAYFKELPFGVITLPPYTTIMNPVESLIGIIKKRIWTLKAENV